MIPALVREPTLEVVVALVSILGRLIPGSGRARRYRPVTREHTGWDAHMRHLAERSLRPLSRIRPGQQHILQLKGWQVRKRALGQRPRIEAKVSRAELPVQRWATDLCRVWGGKDGWLSLALVINCHTQQLLGWHLSRTGKASTASAALEQGLITRYGTLGRVREPFLLRSDNGLVFTSRDCTRLVRSYGLKQEFITPHCPQQNGMVERMIRTLKEQCVHRHRFERQTHTLRVIVDWITFHNQQRPHQALKMMTPDAAYVATLTA